MNSVKPIIEIEEVTKFYLMGEIEVRALRGIDLQVCPRELMAIMGPSGSGKSTLMNILGALDIPTSGKYMLDGEEVGGMTDDQLADIRNRKIGFVFQSFNLLSRTTAIANVELPLIYGGASNRRQRAIEALELVGLGDRINHRPNELSGGQQQRVAIARALVNNPSIILADEPTGNLDSRSGAEIMRIFQELNRDQGITIIFVTHEPDIAEHTKRIIRLHDGRIVSDEAVKSMRQASDRAYRRRTRDLTEPDEALAAGDGVEASLAEEAVSSQPYSDLQIEGGGAAGEEPSGVAT